MNPLSEALLDPEHLPRTLERLDALIDQSEDAEKISSGLGMRLALSMAMELQAGKALGSETADLVAGWVERFGQDTVDKAVGVARAFLIRPGDLARELAQRLPALFGSAPGADSESGR